MFSMNQKREIATKIQEILRETNHPELPDGEIVFSLHVVGAERKIRFQGKEYLLIEGVGDHNSGAIATPDQFNNFEDSTAHLCPDGRVMRYGMKIGTIDDVEFLED